MARYKATKPISDPKKTREKKDAKRKKITFRVFSYVYAALLILGIVITGINYENDLIYGWGHMIMGVITLFAIAFVIYTEKKGWYKSVLYSKERELHPDGYTDKNEIKKDLAEHKFVMIFIGLIYLGLAVYMFVLGTQALLGIR